MRKLIVTTFLTFDGVMQAPGGPEEDDSGGFAHGGWSVNYWDDMMGEVKTEEIEQVVRPPARTPDLRDLRRVLAERPGGGRWQALQRRHEVRLLAEPSLAGLDPGAPDRGRRGRGRRGAQGGRDGPELQVHGSGNLAQTLIRHGLVDEYRLWVFPLVLGSGKRLFADGTIPAALKLVDSKISTTGVFMGTYEPAGEVVTGSF